MRKGFTYIEMIIVLAITGLLLTATVTNFRAGQRQDAVRLGAQRLADVIRRAQSSTIGGQAKADGSVPAGYGVRVTSDVASDTTKAILFADDGLKTGTVNTYDASPDEMVESTSLIPTTSGTVIRVKNITVKGAGGDTTPTSLDIVFTAPLGHIYFNNDDSSAANEAVITVEDASSSAGGAREKTVTINRLTGRIDAQF